MVVLILSDDGVKNFSQLSLECDLENDRSEVNESGGQKPKTS